ncbi:phosphatidylethanolamine-binding protein [Boeremia exigua]|uniref:phosphatidylethanolamine-binding protein n=1 Tax=Boeremia exigua TaxID=749465 RepID=UPI001E8CD4DE|nr:phosphatidylethanolamine-binding protein [Boeremia exigua]KAH6637447.1 phosphatidylethanolamine-binding protein [Boeremia exigua]
MFGTTILTIAAALGLASAQTGPGFPVPARTSLIVSFGNNTISPAGELIPRPETVNPPNISTPVWWASSDPNDPTPPRGVLLIVDLDVPRNGSRVELVHWVATNVTLGFSSSNSTPLIIPNGPVPYLQPSPPVGDVPHSYNVVVFQQPANFSIPAQYSNLTNQRLPFNVSQFVLDTGLGQPVAGSYFQVQNLTGTATTTFPPARTPTSTSGGDGSSPAPFPGAATQVKGETALWVGAYTALIASFAAVAFW